jgi:hypothetical protein
VPFSGDGSALLLHYHDADKTAHICALSTRTGQAVTLIGGTALAVAPDARCVIAYRGDDGVWVGDLTDGSWRCRLEQARSDKAQQVEHQLIVEYRAFQRERLRFRTALWRFRSNDGKLRKTARVTTWVDLENEVAFDGPVFSPDGRCVLWRELGKAGQEWFVLYDVHTGEPRWRRTWTAQAGRPLFSRDSLRIIVPRPGTGQVEVLDATTGATLRSIALPAPLGNDPQFTWDGRTLTVAATLPDEEPHWVWKKVLDWLPERAEPAPMMIVHICDVATGEWVGEAMCEQTGAWWLTDDRRSLIAVYGENDETGPVGTIIRCWDVPPRKPLRWILGVPAALGGVLVSLRYGWRRWRHRRKPTAAAPAALPCV